MDMELLYKNYLDGIVDGNKDHCYCLICDAVDEGVNIKDIYSKIFCPAMVRIGELWQSSVINVAQEHQAVAITRSIISSLYYKVCRDKAMESKGKIILTCPNNELHDMGIRMLANLLEMEGWDIRYLGANVPSDAVIEMIKKVAPVMVGISCTMPFNIDNVKELIEMIKSETPEKPSVLVGGNAFDSDPKLVEYLQADYYGSDFDRTIKLVNTF